MNKETVENYVFMAKSRHAGIRQNQNIPEITSLPRDKIKKDFRLKFIYVYEIAVENYVFMAKSRHAG